MHRAMTEPDRLLEEYHSHLNEHGGLLPSSVPQLLDLMKSAQCMLVPKCISLCILSSTSTDLLSRLCYNGAWDILLKWLQEAVTDDNYPFLIELLNVYQHLPVRLDQLTQNVCPKIINSLTKRCDHEGVRSIALEVVKKWKNVISTDSRRTDSNTVSISRCAIDCDLKRKKPVVIPKDEPHVDIVNREHKKRRTVKMLPTSMRTAGIEDVPTIHPKSRCEVLAKKSKLDPDVRSSLEPSIESFHRKISVSPTENKKVTEVQESLDFINALTNTTVPVVRKKRKPIPKTENVNSNDTVQIKCVGLSDSIEQSDDNLPIESPSSVSPVTIGLGCRKSSLTSLSSAFSDAKPKKRVSWADEEKLHSFFYFELDESERVNVNRVAVEDIRRKDLSMERQLFRRSSDDSGVSVQKWTTPLSLERVVLVEAGYKSAERQTQTERERYVLQAIYFTRESVPESAEEPDPEIVEPLTPLTIPLEDLTVVDSTTNNDGFPAESLLMVKDTTGNLQMSLNPEIADLVKSLAANLSSGSTVDKPVVSKSSDLQNSSSGCIPENKPANVPTAPAQGITSSNKILQQELWEVLEENYPDVNVYELSAERIRDLLEPLRDQLIARGIFQLPHNDACLPPPQLSHIHPTPPLPPIPLPPPFNTPCCGPPTNYPTGLPPPRPMMPPNTHPDFLAHKIPHHMAHIGLGFRQQGPPLMFPSGPPPGPHFPRAAPPMRQGGPIFSGGPVMRPQSCQPCRFFQQGNCRNGQLCSFAHTKR